MKKQGLRMATVWMAIVLMVMTGMTPAMAEGDVIINDLTAQSIFSDLGDALNYGTVAREWDQAAHAETSACVDVLDRHTNTVFANTDSTYFHAMNYKLEVKVSAPQSLQGMSFALYRFDGEKYVRCEGTEKTVTDNVKSTDLTWEVKEDLKNTRLYVFQTDGDGYVADGQKNGLGLQVNYGASVSASAQNDNYIGKIVIHQPMGEGDSMGFFNTFKNSPSLTFGPETRAYYKEFNQETQQYEYIEIIPGVTEKDVGSVLVNYYYTADKDYSAADGDDGLTMGYTKMDGLSYVDGQFVRNGNQVVGVRYMEKGGYADKLLDQAEKVSKKWGNLGGGEITSLTPDTTGGSTVTGPVTDDGYVVSLYDAEVGADGIFQVKKDMGWDGIPVAENEYVIINLICPSKDGKVFMGTDSSDITYFYKEGQGRGEGVMWGTADSNSSQRVIFNFVYADENGIMQPFEGTIEPTARHGGTLLAPKANVELIKEVHNGAIIANYVYNGQEIHQRTLAPLGRETWVKMDGGYLTLDKVALEWQAGGGWGGSYVEGDPLPGAVFGVYTDEACTQLVEKITTDENGVATSGLLAAGDYWVKEITPPDGYGFPTDMQNNPINPAVKVTVVAGDEPTKVVGPGYQYGWDTIGAGKFVNTQSNTQYGDLRVEKIISDNGKPLQGVTFGVYTRQGGYGRPYTYNLVGTMTTNRNGVAVYYDLPIIVWYGVQPYYVKEISAPDGYKISNEEYVEVYLTADGMVTVDGNGDKDGNAFENEIIRGNMALKKVDSRTNANLEGAEFTIYSDRNCTEVVGVMTTKRGGDADSKAVIEGKDGLIPGYYYVKETKAPEGYLLPENPTVYTVHVLPDKMVDVVTGNEIARAPEATAIGNDQAINIAGTKVWYDEGFENSRPQEIRVNLYKGEDTNPYRSVTVSQQTEWKFSFENLHRFDENGKEIVYTIREDLSGKAYDYYTYINEVDENGNITATIANSIKKTKITGKKVWEDTVQYDPDRPNDITFLLFQKVDDELVPVKNQNGQQMTATGSNWNGYNFEFNNLPSYDAKGNKAEYVVQEAESDKYVLVNVTTGSITDQGNTTLEFILKNRLTVPLSGTKVWQDSSNADGNRPENVTLVVYCNDRKMDPQPTIEWDKETDADVWTWKVSGLPKYDENNNLFTYTVKEEPVPAGYTGTVSEDGLTFYNTKPGRIWLYKVYLDENNKNQPLNGAEFKLYRDEACQNPVSDTVYVTAHTGPTRNGFIEITNLIPGDYYIREEKAPEGFALPVPNKPIKVTVVAGQIARVNGDHGVVVNVPDSESTTIAVTKAWAGDEDKMDARPESVTVQLFQNNAPMDGRTMELTADNNWQGEFTKLPGKDANGNAYTYTVKETAVVPSYLSAVTGSVENGFTITNTYNYTSIYVKKEWKGLATLEGLPEVTVQLKANNVAVDGKTVVLSSANNWEASFDQLLIKDENGNEIAYSVEETTVLPDFNVSYSGDKDNGFVVTNTVAGGQITLKKVDGDNGNALSGAKFGIYSDKECQNLVAEMTTGNDGTATSEVIMAGTYYVKEIQAPQNYQISMKDAVEVTVVKDQTVKAQGDSQNGDFTNLKRALVYIKKVEAEKNERGQFDANSAKPLAGAEFTIYSDNNCTQEVAVLVTDENGYAEAALVPGRQYWVKETKAPAGYEIVVTGTKDFWANMGDPMQLTWGNWDQNINGAMVNVKTVGGAITLTKADAADSNVKLSGAVFGVYSDNGCQNKVAEMPATDANGVSTLEHIAVGTWYVKEITAPEGYRLNDTVYTVNVQANQTAQVNNGSPVTNEKKVLSVTAQLAAKKTVNGSSNVPSGYYSFELYEVVNGQRKWLETVQNVAGDVTFSERTFTQAGTYTYLMKEVKGSDATTTYDETEYTATVTVTENSDGLVADVTYGENASATVPTFANTKASVAVQVKKVWNHDGNPMTNTWPSSAQAVLFIDGERPSDGQYIVTLNSSNNWAHVWEDLPKYRLENGQQVEIEYEVYESNVYSDYVVKLEKDETAQENLFSYTITNTYVKKDQKLELKVPVQKIVKGADTDEKFTFKMEARPSDPPAPMPEGAETDEYENLYVTAETTGSASGTTVSFDTIEITAEKVMYDGQSAPYFITYGWTIREIIPDPQSAGVTYDEGWYEILASFQIDEDGKLIFAQRDVWDNDGENIIGSEPDVTIYHYDADWEREEIPYNDGNFVLPFTNTIETTSVSVSKKWVSGEPVNADVTNFLTVHRLEDGKLSDALTDEDNNVLRPTRSADGNTYTFSDLPAGYTYAVKEEKVPGYEASYAPMNIGEDAGQDVDKDFALDGETITNTLVSGGFRFTKQDADGNTLPGAVFGVYAEEGCTTKLYELTSAADGVVSLTELDAGKTYYIKEITAPTGYVLDATVYSVTIEANVNDKPVGNNGVIVNNKIADAKARLQAGKTLNGAVPAAGQFSFTLTGNGVNDTKQNDANGLVVFDELTFTTAGTYTYQIAEKKPDPIPAGYTFDNNTYTATIDVALNAQGTALEAKVSYNTPDGNAPVFQNTYTAAGSVTFTGTKALTGRALAADEFSFELYDANGNKLQTVQNDANGAFVFEEIKYDLADAGKEFTYTVKEKTGELAGVTYDKTVIEVKVKVEDVGGKLTATLAEDSKPIAFTNKYEAAGEITFEGTKTIEGRALTANDAFTFEIKEGEDVIGTATNDASGAIAYPTIKYTLDDVGDHTYTVKETSTDGNGITVDTRTYTVKVNVSDNGDGTLSVTADNNANALNFINKYDAAGEIELEGTKTLVGRTLAEGEFEFQLTDEAGEVVATATNAADGTIKFSKLSYALTDVGKTYIYTAKEVKGALAGVTYDAAPITVKVAISDNGDGTLNVAKTTDSAEIAFTNTYSAEGSILLAGTKSLSGRALAAGEFSFELYDANGELLKTVQNDANGAFVFEEIKYELADAGKEFIYTVKERAGDLPGVTYDETEIEVKVKVEDVGGKLTATLAEDSKPIAFTNKYEAAGEITFEGTKSMEGRALTANDAFTFEIKEGEDVIGTATNDASGKIAYPTIKYTLADVGEHIYTVKETSTDGNGITVDTTEYTVTVTVSDNGDGTLEITASDNATALDFVNTYGATVSVTFEGTKSMEGRTLTAEDVFTFEIAETGTDKTWTAKNDETGKIGYPTIEYTLDDVGEHTYTVKETSTNGNGIIVDGKTYTVTVTVSDNGDGTLKITASDNATALNFKNTYAANGEVVLRVTKQLTGRDLAEEEFSFQLKDAADNVLQTKTNDADGNVIFDSIAYEAAGEYKYTITEVMGESGGVTYDEHVVNVTVNVTDNGEGELTAEAVYEGETTFVNAYEAEGSFELKGEKQLIGREFKEGDTFTFKLSGDENAKLPEVVEVTVTPDEGSSAAFAFATITIDETDLVDGAYTATYTIEEVAGNISGITYDENKHAVKVEAEDNGDGTITIDVKYEDGEKAILKNYYGAVGQWTLTAGKTVDGEAATEDQVFDFGLYEQGILVGSIVKNEAGLITFPTVTYTEEDIGEHIYTVKELGFSGTVSDAFSYVCDETVYTVIVNVEDADGELDITWETSDGEKEITFRNTRLWKVALEKSDRNDTSIKLPGAVYTLYKDAACTDKYADITTGVGGVGFLMNVPAGTYWVKETKAPAGYEVDPEAYEVKVPNGEDISKPVFVPVSDYPMEGNLTLDVEKVMDGRAFQAGDTFTFTISALSGTPMPEKTMVTINPTSGNTAKVDFGKIEFTFEDVGKTYEYTVKETAGDIQGITYDTKFHTAEVKVSEGSNENIIATVTYSDGEKMILTNIYTASNELKLDVEKAITGRAFMAGDSFTFTVEAAENVPMPEKTEVTVEPTSGTTAVVDFGKITYSQADVGKTYEYTVKEKAGEAGGIAYDETAYIVKVAITDNGDGTLTVTPAYEKGSRITFTNIYTANGTYQLKAVKHLDGKALEEGQFTFVLMNGDGKELETAKNGADGSIAFKAMTFNQNDVGKTYAYRIAERNEGVLGYIYDTTVYDVKLNILDNGDGTLTVKADGIPESGMVFENVFNELASFTVRKEWQGKEGPAITLTLYANGQKMDPQPQYVKSGNLYMYENLPVYDENDKAILYSVKEAFMDGYMTIYENTGDYAKVTDQVMNGGKIINRSVTDFAVKKVWEGLTEGEEAPAITLTLYCNGQKVDKPTPTPDKNGWYHYYNLPAAVNGEEAVYTVREEALDGFATTYLSGNVEVEEAGNGDTIVNRKIPKTGDESMIGLWSGMTVLSGAAFILLMKKRRTVD